MSSLRRPYPELSLVGVSLGALQGIIMTASFVYIALKLGFGLAGSTVAAILGFVVLRGVLRRRSIVENNISTRNPIPCRLGLQNTKWMDRIGWSSILFTEEAGLHQ